MIIKHYLHHRSICMVLALCLTLLLVGCTAKSQTAESQTADYGVFLSVTEDLSALRDYKTVVIDAQYFSGAEIEAFRADGHTVYSYLNVGSLENFRDYYATYAPLALLSLIHISFVHNDETPAPYTARSADRALPHSAPRPRLSIE